MKLVGDRRALLSCVLDFGFKTSCRLCRLQPHPTIRKSWGSPILIALLQVIPMACSQWAPANVLVVCSVSASSLYIVKRYIILVAPGVDTGVSGSRAQVWAKPAPM